MTQPFADALAWVPKSRGLGATLGRAHDLARAQGHDIVSLEHLLQSLIEDSDASAVLLSCNIDLLRLNEAVSAHLQLHPAQPDAPMPAASPALLTILEYAVAAAEQSKRPEINGAIVLAAIVGEGRSEAARLLLAAGLKFEDAVKALRRANAPKPPPTGETAAQPVPGPAQPPLSPPPVPAQTGPVPPSQVAPVSQAPPPQTPPQTPPPAPATPHQYDDDPITTARRRIAAIRSGHAVPDAGMGTPAAPSVTQGNASPTAAATNGHGSDWAPPPLPQANGAAPRPPRLPPPVPPVAAPPVKSTHAPSDQLAKARAPWADANATDAAIDSAAAPYAQAAAGPPIDPSQLIERLPTRMQTRTSATVEMRISRASVLGTAAALGGASVQGRDGALTRALTVKLRAPSGGFHVENASPETQWFDTRGPMREEDEVRWRWLITPHGTGRRPLQLSIGMRTIAADGLIVETLLPEYQTTIYVSPNFAAGLRRGMIWVIAAATGVALTLLATGGLSLLFGRIPV